MWPGHLVPLVSSRKTVNGSLLLYVEVPGRTDDSAPFKMLLLVIAPVIRVKIVLKFFSVWSQVK
jgi:hypothetical protein